MIDLGLGDATSVYKGWAASMQKLGGDIIAFPNDPKPIYIRGQKFNRLCAVFRDPAKWVPLVNAGTLGFADQYSKDGRSAFYLAPPNVQTAYVQYMEQDTEQQAADATPGLLDQWGVPKMFQSLGDLGNTVKWGVGAFVLIKLLDFIPRSRRGR